MTYNNTALTFSVQDARTIQVLNATGLHPMEENGKIQSLYNLNGEVILESGQTLLVRNSKYTVKKIEQFKKNCYVIRSSFLNSASIFITPILWNRRADAFWNTNFVNAFVGTDEYPECIAVLFRFSGRKNFTDFEKSIESRPNYLSTKDIDNYQVLYTFKVPDTPIRDIYDKFVAGKYSKIREDFKQHILDFHGYDSSGITYQVLYRSKTLRKSLEKTLDVSLKGMELRSIPDMRYEVFNAEYYKIT